MAEVLEETDDQIGEVQISEYLMLLFAIDTFAGYVEFMSEGPANDNLTRKGVQLLKLADSQYGDALEQHLQRTIPREESKRAIKRSFSIRISNAEQAGRRAYTLRTALNRNTSATLKAVFTEARPRNAVKTAIASSMLEAPAAALDRYAALPIRNGRIKAWIKAARDVVGSGETVHNPVESASAAVLDHVETLKRERFAEEGTTGADAVQETQDRRTETLDRVQSEATEAARSALEVSGEEDVPPTRSEVIGLATAAAAAAAADITNSANVPEALRKLDPEQRAAAMTDGKVLVAAGAGAGKSTTLVSRVKYLVEERGVNPSRILVSSFNKKAAEELKTKIGKAVGGERAKEMQVGTLHGLFKGAISKYGTPEEQAMFRGKIGVLTGSATATAVNRLWRKCFALELEDGSMEDAEAPLAKQMLMFKTRWSGNGITPAMAKAKATNRVTQQAALWYEMYEGLKGGIPGWKPACEDKAEATREFDNFLKKNRLVRSKEGREYYARLGDFDDMITVFLGILKRNPEVRKRAQGAFDHVMIDECQDLNETQNEVLELMTEHITDGSDGKSFWMVGDDKQCVASDTPVQLDESRTVPAHQLREGDQVLALRNTRLERQTVKHVKTSTWNRGFKITTESGRTLTMSPNHKIWAQGPFLKEEQVCVYLMFRRDMGFRVGITKKCQDENYYNSFGGRAFMEKAERMWILDVCPDREEALYREKSYSLAYGVPTEVFEGENRGLNQDRLNRLFEAFGQKGLALLEGKDLNFHLPHWVSQSYTKHRRERRTIQMTAHGSKGTQVTLEWSGGDLDQALNGVHFVLNQDRRRLRKWFTNYRQALEFAEGLQQKTGANLSRRLSTDEGTVRLVTASGLFVGMKVPVLTEGGITLEEIASVEPVVDLEFIDLDIDDASNFFGDGILSHNSIYAFRGARPDIFTGRSAKPDWKMRMIRTNYRCAPEVVAAANKLIAHNEDQIPMEANASPGRRTGEASITAAVYPDEAATAIAVASEIKQVWDGKDADISDNAVLCRTNKELNSYETALLMRGIPYARKGASSFLSSPETKAFLGYITLATDADAEKTQQAFRDILNKPNRFFVGPDQVDRAIDLALNNYARREGAAKKTVDPMRALRDRDFQSDLVSVLTGSSSGFKANKAYGHIDALVQALDGLSSLTQSPEATTKDMFDAVLEMPGTKFKVNATTGRIEGEETVSFRSELSASIKDFGGEDEEVEEERPDEMNLGNISFLYELAKPNPEDPGDVEISPETPKGFWAKMGRLNEKAKELRIDLTAWEKEQDKLPPEDRKPAPGVYLGTIHCSPGDEPVLTTDGWVPMEQLDPSKHRLASYTHSCNQLFWGYVKGDHEGPDGYQFARSTQPYAGTLLTLTTARSKTRVTLDHRIRVKWSESFFNKHVVYLMRRGDWWRVGVAKSGDRPSGGADFKQRVCAEKADACWLLSVHGTKVDAVLEEARVQGFYGLTGLTFEAGQNRRVTSEQLHTIHEHCKGKASERVGRLLADYGLDKKHPLYVGQGRENDMRSAFDIQARNCLSGYMLLPVVSEAFIERTGSRDVWTKPEWHEATVSREPFEGDVHSLVVLPHRYYVSGGAVVHNSVKGAQWPNVYVQMTKGRFPMEPRKKDDEEDSESPERMAEKAAELASERRLAYVALTRPSKNLRIVAPGQFQGKPAGMSRFLEEAGLTTGENVLSGALPKTVSAHFAEDTPSFGVF